MRDIRYDSTYVLAIAPQSIDDPGATPAATNGAAIDLAAHIGANILFSFGATTGGTGDKTTGWPLIQVADAAAGPWTDAPDADVLGPDVVVAEGTNDDAVWTLGYIGSRRFIRGVIMATGDLGEMLVSAVAVLGNPNTKPVVEATPEDVTAA